jgi:hypothetical protein
MFRHCGASATQAGAPRWRLLLCSPRHQHAPRQFIVADRGLPGCRFAGVADVVGGQIRPAKSATATSAIQGRTQVTTGELRPCQDVQGPARN